MDKKKEAVKENSIDLMFDGLSLHSSTLSMQELVTVMDSIIKDHGAFILQLERSKTIRKFGAVG